MKIWFEMFTRFFVFWVMIALAIGFFCPGCLTPLKDFTDWFFIFTMFGIGLTLTLKDFEAIVKNPRLIILGMIAQFGIMPAMGFIIAKVLGLPPKLALGLILVGAVPDAMAAGVISYLARIDVAYAVALTCCSTLFSPVLTPFFTYIYGNTIIPIQFGSMFLSMIQLVIVPLLFGLWARHYLGKYIVKIEFLFPAFSTLFIAFICGMVVALNRDYLMQVTILVFLAVFLHNALGLILGFGAGKLFRFDLNRARTLAISVGMQNAGLGSVLAIKHFSPETAIPNALFAAWCIISASLLAGYWNRKVNGFREVRVV